MDRSRHSERRRRTGVVLLAFTLLAGVAAAVAAAAARQPAETRLAGEHGLWVSQDGSRVTVRWLTAEHGPGVLEAYAGDRRLARTETRANWAHQARFRTRGAEEVLLRYGAADDPDDRHETLIDLRPPRRPPVALTGVDSLYVLGDTHGEYDALVEGLTAAGLIDESLRWTGGRTHVVFAGDLTDRGPDVLALLWLVYRLEREAAAAGGAVHVLLGNHEVMVLTGDLRYVHPKELHVANLHEARYDEMFDVQASILGRWLTSKPGLLRVDRTLIAHGGLGELFAGYDLVEFDDSLRTFVGEELFARWADTTWVVPLDSATYVRRDDFFWHEDSAFWHREYVQSDSVAPLLDRVLRRMDADRLVVGHTRVPEIQARYDGRLIAAHTPRDGAELLLLVRRPDGYGRYRVTPNGTVPF